MMRIGSREFDTEHQTYIMGILNVRRILFRTVENTAGSTRLWPMRRR